MLDKRFKGEENLANKLHQYDSANDVSGIPGFEELGVPKSKQILPFWGIGMLGILIVTIGMFIFLAKGEDAGMTPTKSVSEETFSEVLKKEGIVDNNGEVLNKPRLTTELNINKGANQETSTSRLGSSKEIKSASETSAINTSFEDRSKESTTEDDRDDVENEKLEAGTDYAQEELEEHYGKGTSDLANISSIQSTNEFSEITLLKPVSKPMVSIEYLPSLNQLLELKNRSFKDLSVIPTVIEIVENPMKRVLFGIQYNTGKTHASYHETPFVSPFPTRIEGGKSFGYGLFGQINIDKRSWIRPSFIYNKNAHFQFVEDLLWSSGPSDIILELYSHELKFGVDYGINIAPELNVIELKAGFGLALHQIISLESNNYDTQEPELVKNANELDLSPLSLKAFLGLDVPIYKGIILGVEPYLIYQKRKARYTPSIFLADQGNYDLQSGVNLTLKF